MKEISDREPNGLKQRQNIQTEERKRDIEVCLPSLPVLKTTPLQAKRAGVLLSRQFRLICVVV